MAYNKARAEKEWLKWKTAEEKKLRELGVDEDTIQRLHIYDWTQFNRERRYFQRQVEWTPYIDQMSAQELEIPVNDIESLLNSIENSKLLSVLIKADSLTLQIVLYKLQGFTTVSYTHLFPYSETHSDYLAHHHNHIHIHHRKNGL